jgi:ParB family chromosome partitioning protein
VEEAQGYRDLLENHQYTHDMLAQVIGKSRSHVTNTMRLLQLPDEVLALVAESKLSAGHARALVGRDDAPALARRIVAEGLSVRAVEALMQAGDKPHKPAKEKPGKPADTRAVEEELSSALGLGVALRQGRGERGELRIRYASLDQFEEIRARLLQGSQRRSV